MNARCVKFPAVTIALSLGLGQSAHAESLALADSFRIGNSGVLCTAQNKSIDPRLGNIFDRAYAIVCRDAAASVGQLYALRARGGQEPASFAAARQSDITCEAAVPVQVDGVANARRAKCQLADSGLGYVVYSVLKKGVFLAAEGLAGYDIALKVGFQSLALDRTVNAAIDVAVTDSGDPTAFARLQAGNLDPQQALAEGYSRNNEGNYAEAAEFFETLSARSMANSQGYEKRAEYLANQALQQSNLGNFAQAGSLFNLAAQAADNSDPLIIALIRNFRTVHALNQTNAADALRELAAGVALTGNANLLRSDLAKGVIDQPLSQRLSIDDDAMVRLGGVSMRLTVPERLALLNAQGDYLRGAAQRMLGRGAEARISFTKANDGIAAVRGGKVESMSWLRAATLNQLGIVEEASGNFVAARKALDDAVLIYGQYYPGSANLLAARGRIAGLLARSGDKAGAIAMFREIVADGARTPGSGPVLRGLIRPYFDALVGAGSDERAAADFFAASQTLTRPGVAQTQAVFARELSAGSDEAAALFRQSLNITREIVQTQGEVARLQAMPDRDAIANSQLSDTQKRLATLSQNQTALLARLAEFPRFRTLTSPVLPLDDLQKKLKPGEAYYKLALVGETAYGLLVSADKAQIFRLDAKASDLAEMTGKIRESISTVENGQRVTFPFDVVTARKLYSALFGPVDGQMGDVRHLIFEPDGPLMQLPVNLLVKEQAGVDAYLARIAKPDADEFDMTGVAWLGRSRMVTTAVSPQAFLDIRAIAPSKAKRRYLGLGENSTPAPTINLTSGAVRGSCDWPMAQWGIPISADELRLASTTLGGTGNQVLTGQAFSDDGLRARGDLADYRVIHFATHGLVSAPRSDCPARPALLTSFGGAESDGLLSFKEIFDLRLDADMIILSACDTAGAATAAATREAGISTGGNFALDGLVRAFVGAGARAVIASHWPVPDDFDATKKLMSGLFSNAANISVGESMRQSQVKLMDNPETSHPYYWSGFAIIGDADKPMIGG